MSLNMACTYARTPVVLCQCCFLFYFVLFIRLFLMFCGILSTCIAFRGLCGHAWTLAFGVATSIHVPSTFQIWVISEHDRLFSPLLSLPLPLTLPPLPSFAPLCPVLLSPCPPNSHLALIFFLISSPSPPSLFSSPHPRHPPLLLGPTLPRPRLSLAPHGARARALHRYVSEWPELLFVRDRHDARYNHAGLPSYATLLHAACQVRFQPLLLTESLFAWFLLTCFAGFFVVG